VSIEEGGLGIKIRKKKKNKRLESKSGKGTSKPMGCEMLAVW